MVSAMMVPVEMIAIFSHCRPAAFTSVLWYISTQMLVCRITDCQGRFFLNLTSRQVLWRQKNHPRLQTLNMTSLLGTPLDSSPAIAGLTFGFSSET